MKNQDAKPTRAGVKPGLLFPLLLLLLAACDVPEPAASTGGVQLDDGACGRGLVVIGSNYSASNVALLDLEGGVRSSSILSSGTSSADVSLPLSGDVVAPTERPSSGEIVLLDRYPNAVLTWLDPAAGVVRAQLSVATGFPSNPQDYLEVAPGKAYVPRQNSAPKPGSEPFDEGGDVLVIDTHTPAIVSRIAFDAPAPYLPRPARMLRVGARVWVLLLRMNVDFTQALDSSIRAIDPGSDQIAWSMDIPGMANCGVLARSPGGGKVAVACTGVFAEGLKAQLDRSGVVLLDASKEPPVELRRISGEALGASPSFVSMAFADEERLLVPLYGDLDKGLPDRLVEVTTGGEVRPVYEAKGAFVLGDVRCVAPCALRCFLSDAEGKGVRRVESVEGSWVTSLSAVAPELGLPPRNMGSF